MNQMSKFELHPTVNESGKSILLKLCILVKYTITQRLSHSPSDCATHLEYEK